MKNNQKTEYVNPYAKTKIPDHSKKECTKQTMPLKTQPMKKKKLFKEWFTLLDFKKKKFDYGITTPSEEVSDFESRLGKIEIQIQEMRIIIKEISKKIDKNE